MRVTVTVVTKIMNSSQGVNFEKMAERLPDFEIQEIQELKETQKTKILRKVHQPGPMSGPYRPKIRTLNQINRWHYMTEFLRF